MGSGGAADRAGPLSVDVHQPGALGLEPAQDELGLGRQRARARAGGGPTLVEALTYRIEAHTNADDATRYRTEPEVDAWREHDPILLMDRALRELHLLDDGLAQDAADEAEALAARMRAEFHADPELDPMALFTHVYAEPTPQLREQAAQLSAELAAEAEVQH